MLSEVTGAAAPQLDPSAQNQSGSPLTVVPPPSLEEQLDSSKKEVRRLVFELNQNETLTKSLQAQLDEYEKNPLLVALMYLDSGAVLQNAGDQMRAVVEGMEKVGGKGSLALKLVLKPMNGVIVVSADVKAVVPKQDNKTGLFFPMEGGGLSRKDSRQRELDFARNRVTSDGTNDER